MKEILVPVRVRGSLGERRVKMLFDTGATISVIREDVARSVGTLFSIPRPNPIRLADGSKARPIRFAEVVAIELKKTWFTIVAYVLPGTPHELILGCGDMEQYDIRPVPRNGSYVIPKPKVEFRLI